MNKRRGSEGASTMLYRVVPEMQSWPSHIGASLLQTMGRVLTGV